MDRLGLYRSGPPQRAAREPRDHRRCPFDGLQYLLRAGEIDRSPGHNPPQPKHVDILVTKRLADCALTRCSFALANHWVRLIIASDIVKSIALRLRFGV